MRTFTYKRKKLDEIKIMSSKTWRKQKMNEEYDFKLKSKDMDISLKINERTLATVEKILSFVKEDIASKNEEEIKETESQGLGTLHIFTKDR